MLQKLHKNAKTNYHIRQYIKSTNKPLCDLAKELNLNVKTVRKWKRRDDLSDKSSKPIRLRTNLTSYQEDLIVYERKAHKKTLFEIWDSLDKVIPNLYPMKIYRVLDRWGLSVLPKELTEADRLVRKFRKYTIGYLHIDLIYTPKFVLPNGTKKRWYIFTCIDRVSKLAFVWLTNKKTQYMSKVFLDKVIAFYPYKINYILTDNGLEFTYKAKAAKTKLIHPFDKLCHKNKIRHRLIRFAHPWTNGMVERFNQKIKQNVIKRYLFQNVKELNEKLIFYVNRYNFELKLQQLNRKSPIQYLVECFSKQLKKHPQRIVS
ncbi:MAG: IS481 family transposase [Candidatus Microgenomates bacterium]